MKCSIFLLYVIIGCVCGLQAPLHYKYKYYGSVSNGIFELSSKGSGWAMKADVIVYVLKDDGEAVFEIHNVKMFEFASDLGCDSRGNHSDELFLDIEDPNLKSAFESPFKAHLFHYEDFAIEHVDDGYKWLPNMRKGIVSVFRNKILKGNIENQINETVSKALHEGHVENVFSVDEETLFGICTVHYTIHPIPEHLAASRNEHLEGHYEQDIQRKSSDSQQVDIPHIKDDLWHVVRSIDFDKCTERVALEGGNTFEASDMNTGQHDWRRSRSSITEFIFRGSAGHFRLEKAVVEGARTMAPYGYKTELMQSTVNQVFHLISVESADTVPSPEGNLKHSKNWMHHFFSPGPTPTYGKNIPWIEYETEEGHVGDFQIYGMEGPSDEQVQKNKMELFEHLFQPLSDIIGQPLSSGITPRKDFVISTFINAIHLFRAMTTEEILETFRSFDEKYELLKNSAKYKDNPSSLEKMRKLFRQLVVDIASSSGPGEVYQAILMYAKEGKVAPIEIMTMFMSLTPNKQDAFAPKYMMDYVLSMNLEENPFTSSTILINWAYFLNRLCSIPDAKHHFFYGPNYAKNPCPNELIKNDFVPYLETMIFNEESTWEKNVAILTLRNLGLSHSYQIFTSIITQEKMKFPIHTRIYALESLDSRMFFKYNIREPVLNLLTDIYTNVGEDISIRETALGMVLFWAPDADFFYRLAKMSWRDPSKQFSALATSVIEVMAKIGIPELQKQEQAASHALKFAKPAAPSLKYTHFKIIGANFVDKHLFISNSFALYTSDKSSKLKSIYYGLFGNFGGFPGNQIEIDVETERLINMYKTVMEAIFREEDGKMDGIAAKAAEEFYSSIEETIKSQIVPNDGVDPGDIYVALFQHMKIFLPNFFSSEVFSQPDSSESKFEINFAKFITPIQVRTAYPNELGLTVFLEIFAPILASAVGESDLKPEMDKDLLGGSINFDLNIGLAADCHSTIEVILPWSKRIVDIRTISLKEVNLPLKGAIHMESDVKDKSQFNLRVDLETPNATLVHFISASSFSWATMKPIFPVMDQRGIENGTIVDYLFEDSKKFPIPNKFTGLNLEVDFDSNMEFPFSEHKIEDMFSDPSSFLEAPFMPLSFVTSTLKYWRMLVNLYPDASDTKNISIIISKGKFGKDDVESAQNNQDQESAENLDENDDSSDEHMTADSYIKYEDSTQARSEKLQSIYGGPGDFTSLKLSFDGNKHRSFEVLLAKAKSKQSDSRRLKKSGITFIRSPIPEFDDDSSLVCVNFKESLPSRKQMYNINNYSSNDPLHKETELEVLLGCTGEPIIELEGKYKLSEAWASKLKDDLPKYCDFDQYNEKQTLQSHLIYDDVKFEVEWKNICNDKYPITSKAIRLLNELEERFSNDQCYTFDETHKMNVEVHRCPITGNWDIKVLQENSEETFKQIPQNHIFTHLFSIGKKTSLELHPEIHSLANLESDNCIIGVDSVRTHDGYTYEYKPSQCWSVASKVCNKEKGPMLLVRSPDSESTIPELKYIDVEKGIIVEYSHDKVKVNDKEIDPNNGKEVITDDHGHTLLTVVKKDTFFMVKFEDHFYISAKNKVVVHAPSSYSGSLCGMCGNFNGEPVDDLIGPHRCFYSDPYTFVASWTGNSDTCDSSSLLELREEAENYQNECSTVEDINKSRSQISKHCYYPAKSVSKTDDSICISKNYLLFCDEGCEAIEHTENNELFLCWSNDHAPPSLKDVISSDAVLTDNDIEENYKYSTFNSVKIPTLCIPNIN